MKQRHARPFVALLLSALALTVLGCASADLDGYVEQDQLALALRSRGLEPAKVVVPYVLDESMREWMEDVKKYAATELDRLNFLQAKLLNPKEMKIEYQWGYTGTASEVFSHRKANCLAFTNLFVGMARELGIPVYFLMMEDVESYRKEGDLVVVSDHIAVGYGSPIDRLVFDFSERKQERDYRFIRKISDLTAIAMFHSNRGAEALQLGQSEIAIDWLRMAVRIDPELANGWINLGVALRRHGDKIGAEAAYKKSLELDPRIYSAYHNLISLMRAEGRREEAEGYELTLSRAPSRNPYTYLSLGDISLVGGRLEEAEKFYRRAIHLNSDVAEGYAALGQLALSAGDLRKARRMLRKAERAEIDNPRAERLRSLIEVRERGGENRMNASLNQDAAMALRRR